MKSSSSNQQHLSIRCAQCIRRSLVAPLLLFCLIATGKIYAQEVPVDTWYCGIRLTVSGTYNMTNDITCPAGAVGIEVVAEDVTLNLQGHSISGAFKKEVGSSGIIVYPPSVAIKGPGKIQGFAFGIKVAQSDTVSHVQIERCSFTGIYAGSFNRILYNTLREIGSIGISVPNAADNAIVGNTITRSQTALWLPYGTGHVVQGNTFVGNSYGMTVYGISIITVTGNDISNNSNYGAAIHGSGTITGNHFNANARFGLTVAGGSFLIQDNTTDSNGEYGISIGGITSWPPGSNNTIKLNAAIGNGLLDLYWDGNGTGNTWTANNCDTWSLNMGDSPCVTP